MAHLWAGEQRTIHDNTHFEVEGLAPVHTAYLIHLSVQLLEPVHRHLTTLGIRAGTVETGVQENLGDEGHPLLDLPLHCSMTCCRCVPAAIVNEQMSQINSTVTHSLAHKVTIIKFLQLLTSWFTIH
jgi:hypothetical protein